MRRVIDRLGMHAASLPAVAGKARAAGGPKVASTEPAPPSAPTKLEHDGSTPPPISGEVPEPAADVFIPSVADERWVAENSCPPIRSAGDLLAAIGQFRTSLGLEPDVRGDTAEFLFCGRLHRIELEDVESRLEHCQVSEDELTMMAAGPPVG
jgi:hypothetical protein